MFSFLKGHSAHKWGVLLGLSLGLCTALSAYQVIIRPPVAPPVITITVPSASPTFDAGTSTTIAVSGSVSSLTTILGCTWVNSLGGSGTAPVGVGNKTWTIASVALTPGLNSVTVSCVDLSNQTRTDNIVITRTLPAIPVVTINVPTSSPTFDAGTSSSLTVSGTASTSATITGCTWINSLGGSGSTTGTTAWSVAGLSLTVGSNIITVTCIDSFTQTGNDVITITRSAPVSGSNPISAARMPSGSATLPDGNWGGAGVQGGIPTSWPNCDSSNCNAIAPGGLGTVSGATIQTALNTATVGGVSCATLATACVVRIRTVTASFAGGFTVPSFHVVRGTGANTTLLTMTSGDNGTNGDNCGFSYAGAIGLCGHPVNGDTVTATWSGTMTKGTSRITLSARTGIVAGKTPIVLNQLDESDGYPNVGDMYLCESGFPCSGNGGGASNLSGSGGESGRTPSQMSIVTACVSTACSTGSGQVDIDPPITLDDFRTAKSPHAVWEGLASNQAAQWAGVEDLSMDYGGAQGGLPTCVEIANATNVWVKGVRCLYTPVNLNYGFIFAKVVHATIQSSYLYRPNAQPQQGYPDAWWGAGAILFQNNIFHGVGASLGTTLVASNSVVGYNFTVGNDGPMFSYHGAGEVHNLLEGNIGRLVWIDVNEGTKGFLTLFRNALIGRRYSTNTGTSNIDDAIQFESRSRFNNVVGNVIGDASNWSVYENQSPSGFCGNVTPVIYNLGAPGCSGTFPPADSRVAATMVRWFNWDDVTSTAPTVNGDQTGTRCVAGEVPTGITFLSNPLPGTCGAPTSLYLAAKPAWFQAQPWPGIGPDVSGGPVTNLGGHVYLNPAAICYLTTLGGAANGSSGVLPFNAAACYGSTE